jgi:hypothetical protein
MVNLKFFAFNKQDGEFPILKDPILDKKMIKEKIQNQDILILGLYHKNKETLDKQIIMLKFKYAENMNSLNSLIPDRTPVMYKDYIPENPS